MMMKDELVVLVDNEDREIGTALKAEVHTDKTPLHRAFSLFIFNKNGQVLVTQRALSKKTWPGIWSNSCCGHPVPGESYEAAIVRRVEQELGCRVQDIERVSDYRYRFEYLGIVENEICPVYRGVGAGIIRPNREEVNDWKWMDWNEWMKVLKVDKPGNEGVWSEWCK